MRVARGSLSIRTIEGNEAARQCRTVRFFKGVCDTMKQDLHLPADYAVLSDNEMTYTQGGGVISTLLGLYSTGATIVGTGVLAASYAWGIPADP